MRLPAALGALLLTAATRRSGLPPPPARRRRLRPGHRRAAGAQGAVYADAGHGEGRRRGRRPRHHGLRGDRCLRRLGGAPAAAHDHHQLRRPGHRDGVGLCHLGIQGRAEVPLPHAPDDRHRGDQPDRRRSARCKRPAAPGRRTTPRRTTAPARCRPARCSRWRIPPRSSPRRATRSISSACRCSTARTRTASRTASSWCWTGSRRCQTKWPALSPLPSTRVHIAFFDHTAGRRSRRPMRSACATGRTASPTT